ncbi:MAG: transcriptional repressor LexA [Chloroflexi bacterium]|nr:transcriptional repressor LexA [Chloroflexota bacterium]
MAKEKPLSSRQQNMLRFIWEYVRENGRPPTIREIGKNVKISSTSVVNYNLNKLKDRGLLERDADVSRGLRFTERATAMFEEASEAVVEAVSGALARIPLVGTIAAGRPIDLPDTGHALYDDEDMVGVSPDMLRGDISQLFALTIKGNSMIDAMVNDGDIVIMREQKTAENGEMVAVWLKDDDTTTLKHFHREGQETVRLQPANPTMDPIFVGAADVEIQGKVMMVLRQTA